MAGENGLKRWLRGQRTSTRLAYALQLGSRICASFMGLIWIRLLLAAMGRPLNGVLLAFQNVVTLGGLGDLGMGGAVGIRTGQYLGQGDEAGLKKFLVSARAVFLLMALTVGGGFLVFSPWLPRWLGFGPVPGIAVLNTSNTTPLLVPGRQYYLGITNYGATPAMVVLEINFATTAGTNLSDKGSLPMAKAGASPTAMSVVAGVPSTNLVPANSVVRYEVNVPSGASAATNILMVNSGEAGLLFNQDGPPGTVKGDLALIPRMPTGGTGSLTLLFAVGAVLVGGMMLSSYLTNLNYACGNVTWPVVPAFVLLQVGLLFQWLLARQHEPLWVQLLPSMGTAAAGLWLYRFYISKSHPTLAGILPLKLDWPMAATLFESSFWIYLCTLGNAIYRATDSLVINAGFPAGTLPDYTYNYKFCDLVVFLALTAGFVSLPKITQWMASADPKDQDRVRVEMRRLNQFQTLLGCGAAFGYLAVNDVFMKIWFLHSSNPVPPAALGLQTAFALNMAITASGDVGIQMSIRSGKNGLRFAGLLIGATGLLNVALSIVAMEKGSLWGIAMATVLAQSLLSVGAGFYTCRHLQIGWVPWLLKGWLLPCAGILGAAWLRRELPFYSAQHVLLYQNILLLGAAYLAGWLAAAWGLGMNAAFIRQELALIRTFFRS
jgi:O-antigen/teichoic acid export membrane protein